MSTTRKTLAMFWRANAAHPRLFFGTIGSFTAGMTLQKICLPIVVAQAINTLVAVQAYPVKDYWPIFLPYIIAFTVIMIAAQCLSDYGLTLLFKMQRKVRPELQMRIYSLLIHQSLNFHANSFSGALVNQTNKFTSAYISLTDMFTFSVLMTIIICLFSITAMAFFLPIVSLAMAIWTVLFVWLNITLTRQRMPLARVAAEADSILTAHLADTVGNVGAIKAFGREQDELVFHKIKSADRAAKRYRVSLLAVKNDFVFGIMMGILQLAVLVVSIYAVMQGAVAIGTLLLVQVYVAQLIGQLWSLSSISRNIEQALSDAAEMTETLDREIEVKDPRRPLKFQINKGVISFENVDFTHDGSEDALFSNFTLQVKPGEKVGLVGHSGSGKTSLTRLLLRFVDISGGAILIDGQDTRKVKQADLRAHIAYVPQEPVLFHRSLRENIAYGKPDASDAQVRRAAKLAHAAEFIEKLPKGYETLVGERGVKLSGGQRQRVAIARAMLKDAPILVLDEATSALDSESELLIQDALWKLMQGRTTIVIAHRLSTIQKMDRIVVLEEGKIIEQGAHADLLAQNGTYAKLWAHQSGGFIED